MILEPIWAEDHKLRISSLAFSTDGTLLASGDESGGIKIWDTTTGKLVRALHQQEPSSRVYSLAFSPDDLTLAAGDDFSIQLWEIATGNRISSFESVWHDGKGSPPVVSLAWRPDGKIIAYGSDTPKLLDVQSGIILKEFIGHEDYIIALAWNQAGTLLASGGAEEDSIIRLWNPDDGTQ